MIAAPSATKDIDDDRRRHRHLANGGTTRECTKKGQQTTRLKKQTKNRH
jgi:hypothetical protein